MQPYCLRKIREKIIKPGPAEPGYALSLVYRKFAEISNI